MSFRRINLFGGPGCGKSTIAAKIYFELKINGLNIELCQEYIKNWSYQNRPIKAFDQYYIFGKQSQIENLYLSNGVKFVITDSPLWMQIPYARKYGVKNINSLIDICKEFDVKYPALNIFLERKDIPYQNSGRYESYDEALIMDKAISNFLEEVCVSFVQVSALDSQEIVNHVLASLQN